MNRQVRYSPEVLAQLDALKAYLAESAGSSIADAYLDRLLNFCDGVALDPVAGRNRDDLVPGLRTRTFEKSRVVCFLMVGADVHILAVYGTRQDWERHLHDPRGHP